VPVVLDVDCAPALADTSPMHTIETVSVDGSPMEVFVFRPAGAGPHPGLILAQHLPVGHTGIENDEFTLKTAERYAAHGYVVAAPFIFHWWPKSADMQLKRDESRDERMVADMKATFTLLEQRADVEAGAIGVAGHCWGGRVAWLAACHLPRLAAAAIFYGGRVRIAMGADNPPPIELATRIRCPVIGFFGDEDQNPSPGDVDEYDRALTAARVPHTFHRYAGAGHAFQNFPTPERYHAEASEDAWRKSLAFFAQHLGGAAG
jgi:carboxymethylenebutenolidase